MEAVDHPLFNFTLATDEMQRKRLHPFEINIVKPSFVINKCLFDCKLQIEELTEKSYHYYQSLWQKKYHHCWKSTKRRIVFIYFFTWACTCNIIHITRKNKWFIMYFILKIMYLSIFPLVSLHYIGLYKIWIQTYIFDWINHNISSNTGTFVN